MMMSCYKEKKETVRKKRTRMIRTRMVSPFCPSLASSGLRDRRLVAFQTSSNSLVPMFSLAEENDYRNDYPDGEDQEESEGEDAAEAFRSTGGGAFDDYRDDSGEESDEAWSY